MTDYARLHELLNAPQLGQRIPGLGEIVSIRCDGAERYYFLIDDYGTVAFMPACLIEPTSAGHPNG